MNIWITDIHLKWYNIVNQLYLSKKLGKNGICIGFLNIYIILPELYEAYEALWNSIMNVLMLCYNILMNVIFA